MSTVIYYKFNRFVSFISIFQPFCFFLTTAFSTMYTAANSTLIFNILSRSGIIAPTYHLDTDCSSVKQGLKSYFFLLLKINVKYPNPC